MEEGTFWDTVYKSVSVHGDSVSSKILNLRWRYKAARNNKHWCISIREIVNVAVISFPWQYFSLTLWLASVVSPTAVKLRDISVLFIFSTWCVHFVSSVTSKVKACYFTLSIVPCLAKSRSPNDCQRRGIGLSSHDHVLR